MSEKERVNAIMQKSLRTDRWVPLNLGADKDYKESAIVDRWHKHRDTWLNVRTHMLFNHI